MDVIPQPPDKYEVPSNVIAMGSYHYVFAHEILPALIFPELHHSLSTLEGDHWTTILRSAWEQFAQNNDDQQGAWNLSVSTERLEYGRRVMLVRFPPPREELECYFAAVLPLGKGHRYLTLERLHVPVDGAMSGVLCEWVPERTHQNWGIAVRPDEAAFIGAVRRLIAATEIHCLVCGEDKLVNWHDDDLREESALQPLETCPTCHLTLPVGQYGEHRKPHLLQKLVELVHSPDYKAGISPTTINEIIELESAAASSPPLVEYARLTLARRALECLEADEAWVECCLHLRGIAPEENLPQDNELRAVLMRHFENAPPSIRTGFSLAEIYRRRGNFEQAHACATECLAIVNAERPAGRSAENAECRRRLSQEREEVLAAIPLALKQKEAYFDATGKQSDTLFAAWKALRLKREALDEQIESELRVENKLTSWETLVSDLVAIRSASTARDASRSLVCRAEWPAQVLGAAPLWWKQVALFKGSTPE